MMGMRVCSPRLLQVTIVALGALLSVKTAAIVQSALADDVGRAKSDQAPKTPDARGPWVPSAGPAAPPAPADHEAAGARATGAPPTVSKEPEPSAIDDRERALLLDLRARRTELDQREAATQAKEQVIAAAERKIAARADELAALQARIESLDKARADREAQNWQGLVKVYESMKPRDAAAIFNDLDKPVLLEVLDRMKEAKASAILAAMQPERARQATADLAAKRVAATTVPETLSSNATAPPNVAAR
ncbi:MAG: hypothetical protein JOY70_03160 [Acidisphaera sp.]|nr:hypothetical protein [Acidisphaera sp.]